MSEVDENKISESVSEASGEESKEVVSEKVEGGRKNYYENEDGAAEITKEQAQKELQANNLVEEAREILTNCTKCGECKGLCPVFKSLRQEDFSPRGHAVMLSEKTIRRSLYLCTMCKACETRCPMNIKVCDAIAKAREALVLRDQGLKSSEETQKSLEEIGNPFVKR